MIFIVFGWTSKWSIRVPTSTLKQLLKPGGLVLNHGITSTDASDGETPYAGGDFIHRYVFPHSELLHIGIVLKEMQKGG